MASEDHMASRDLAQAGGVKPTKRVPWPNLPRETIRAMIEARVRVEDESQCWVWRGYVGVNGYGELSIGPRASRVRHRAHRLAFYAWRGEILQPLVIDHVCRNRRCCNPAHLRQVTVARNNIENSSSVGAINFGKTHCARGHLLSGPNLRLYRGERECRRCRAARNWRHRHGQELEHPNV